MPTARDEVWSAIVQELVRTGRFRVSDLDLDESKRHTVNRVCKEMEDMGWLTRDSPNARIWRPGKLAQFHLNIPEEARASTDE